MISLAGKQFCCSHLPAVERDEGGPLGGRMAGGVKEKGWQYRQHTPHCFPNLRNYCNKGNTYNECVSLILTEICGVECGSVDPANGHNV